MFQVDLKTLFLTYTFINTIVIVLFLIYVFTYKDKTPIIKIFIFGRILGVLAITFMSLRNIIPDFLSITLGNFLLLYNLSYEIFSIFSINTNFNKKIFKNVNIITGLLCIFFIFFISSPENIRIVVSSFNIFIIYTIGAVSLLFNKSKTKIQKLAGYFILFASIIYFARFIKAIYNTNSLLFSNDIVQITSYLYLLFLSFTFPIVFLFIFKEKDTLIIANDNIKLQELNDAKNKLFSIIAHDLRGSLGGLQQIGGLLLKNEESNEFNLETKKKFTENIYKTSKKTFNLLDNLLKWASSNSGNIKVSPININFKNIIDKNISFFKTEAMLKNIEISSNINKNLIVFADYNMLDTVIRNLISNAIKFTDISGKIEITRLINQNSDNYITLVIKDNGVGMSDEDALKVLEIDSSISTLGTKNESGTGFGLKLCNEFIKKNKGTIRIESEINKGTKIFLTLPKIEII